MGITHVRDLLYRLADAGWIRRLRHGYYAVAGLTPGVPEIPEFFIATQIVKPSAISHWSAMSHHGFTEQIPRRVTALTTKRVRIPARRPSRAASGMNKQHWEIGQVHYEFIYVLPAAFFGIEEIWLGEFFKVPITDKERTILEGFICAVDRTCARGSAGVRTRIVWGRRCIISNRP
jgi:predicted transcriptional regulator of viral defense system